MKEDILEQLVDDYLKFNGFFTIHNVKFRPSDTHPDYIKTADSVASDVDVIGFHPIRNAADKVWVVSCKSWQIGFDPKDRIEAIEREKKREGRPAWQSFRELVKPKWANALLEEVERLTGTTQFTYVTAVTKLIGSKVIWEQNEAFKKNLGNNPIRILTLQEMLSDLYGKTKTTIASSEIGRLLQIIKASGWKP
ncbi:MAG TPA: hypothetical protein VNW97_17000 [Candidatus Saccharimonadales bacterium]|jgi:hypothetical protein|nr:hypothetical protein [Candidatus Saccharimonadales bacterium]